MIEVGVGGLGVESGQIYKSDFGGGEGHSLVHENKTPMDLPVKTYLVSLQNNSGPRSSPCPYVLLKT